MLKLYQEWPKNERISEKESKRILMNWGSLWNAETYLNQCRTFRSRWHPLAMKCQRPHYGTFEESYVGGRITLGTNWIAINSALFLIHNPQSLSTNLLPPFENSTMHHIVFRLYISLYSYVNVQSIASIYYPASDWIQNIINCRFLYIVVNLK